MNKLSAERRARVIQALFEGNSVRATCRLTGTAKGTVLRLLAEIGEACARFHDKTVRNVPAKRVQCDEIWSYVGIKERNLRPELRGTPGMGDTWVWVALDQDSKLAISWAVGDRGPETAGPFVKDLASRLANRVQLTTDGHSVYLNAVAEAFHYDVDYAFSKKLENHVYAVALHFVAYNFCKPHGTLTKRAGGIHTTPAMAAGLTRRVWTVADLMALISN